MKGEEEGVTEILLVDEKHWAASRPEGSVVECLLSRLLLSALRAHLAFVWKLSGVLGAPRPRCVSKNGQHS